MGEYYLKKRRKPYFLCDNFGVSTILGKFGSFIRMRGALNCSVEKNGCFRVLFHKQCVTPAFEPGSRALISGCRIIVPP